MRVATTALALVMLGACTREAVDSPLSPTPAGRLTIDLLATSASIDQTQGTRRAGRVPAVSGGPVIDAAGNTTVVTGGTQAVTLSSGEPFQTVYVSVDGRSLGLVGESGGGVDGYYELQLPAPQTTATVLLTLPLEVPVEQFDLQVGVGTAAGAVGPPAAVPTRVLGVGTGDVQVTLAWDRDSDVDLHVVGPGGDEVYYGRRQSPSGGELDLDSNAACDIDGVRNENITWPVGQAPAGAYVVRVNYWSSCGVERTNYTVRINNGGSVQILTGTLTGAGNGGGLGAGQVIATFERTSGPSALTQSAVSPGAVAGSPVKVRAAGGRR